MIVFLMVLSVVVVLVVNRRRRKRMLAGLDATRPTFNVEPPKRRLGSRRTEVL